MTFSHNKLYTFVKDVKITFAQNCILGNGEIMNDDKITIGLFNDTYYPLVDGVVQVVDNYARLLSKKAKVIVFVPKGRDKHYKDAFPYQVVRSKRMRVFFLDYDLALPQFDNYFKKVLKNAKLDIVHIHSPFTMGKIGLEYAKKHHIPCVATMHSQFKRDFKRSLKTPLLTPIVSILMASIRSVFNNTTENWAVNGEVGRIFHEEYKVKNKPIVMLNGTDMQPVTDKTKITALREKYKIRPETGSSHPERTNTKYCVYDSMNKNYGYTQAWVDFLIEQMNKDEEYNSLFE